MAECRGCGAEIKWIRSKKGKPIPCEVKPALYTPLWHVGAKVVTPEGEVKTIIEGGESIFGYLSHFATCPFAERFRR
jgi:hypothetical protein